MKRMAPLAAIPLLIASAASVQSKSVDTRIPTWKQSDHLEGNSAVRTVYVFAVCSWAKRKDQVNALLRSGRRTREEGEALAALTYGKEHPCLRRADKMTMRSRALFRGALAEAVYNGGKMRPKSKAPIPLQTSAEAADPALENSAEAIGGRVATCAAARNPLDAHRTLAFNPGSPGEMRALVALRNDFLSCLPAGKSLAVSRLMIRALLAEALYQAAREHKELFINA